MLLRNRRAGGILETSEGRAEAVMCEVTGRLGRSGTPTDCTDAVPVHVCSEADDLVVILSLHGKSMRELNSCMRPAAWCLYWKLVGESTDKISITIEKGRLPRVTTDLYAYIQVVYAQCHLLQRAAEDVVFWRAEAEGSACWSGDLDIRGPHQVCPTCSENDQPPFRHCRQGKGGGGMRALDSCLG
jgi:hypothetical protein